MRVLSFSSVVVLTTDKERCSMQPIVHYVFAAALIPVATAPCSPSSERADAPAAGNSLARAGQVRGG